ncbi:MAG: helicase-associated domain-containing protein [Ardenticatenaceae bacterium]|nr:helicase-associated domain-containing protein [Ardenticatenaceae bacterium]
MAREAQLSGTTGKKLKKAELLALMTQEFFRPERIKTSYKRLAETERAVINRLLLHGGQVSTRLFKRELIRANMATEALPKPVPKGMSAYANYQGWSVYGRAVTHIGQPNDTRSTIFEDVMARLTLYGLVFSEEAAANTGGQPFKLQYHPGSKLIIPLFVSQHLPKPEPLPIETTHWQPAHTLHGDPQLLLRDLYLYWDTVRRSPIAMIKSGLVSKRGLKLLNDNLLTPDPTLDKAKAEDDTGLLFPLRQMLQSLKLVKTQHGELQTTENNGRAIPQFWQDTTIDQIKAVITAWRTLRSPLRLNNYQSHYAYTPDVQSACQYLLTILAELPADTWIEADTLLDSLQERNVDFLIPARSRIENQRYYYYNNPSELIGKMDQLEQGFVAQVMADFLFQVGLVELGFDAPPTTPNYWNAFRLTPLGTAVLKNTTFDTPPTTGQIIIQPNFQILAMGPVPLNLLAQLDLFAERQKVDRSAFEYHLSRESVYAAQQRGYAAAEVERFLTAVTSNDLPQNIRRSLAEWAAHHERIVFRSGVTLLQAADEALLQQLLENPDTGKLLARPVGNAVALVKDKRQPQLVEALQTIGILPAVSGANPEAADKSVTVNEDGRIQPIHAVPSLHLRGRLARFSEEAGDEWQLTETAVRRAGGNKKKAQNIIDELKKLHRGRLPHAIEEKVKAWGGYYGSATVGTMTLFEFRDQETLAELCQLAELKDLLQPFSAGKRALAVVDGERVTAVQTILARLGVIITPLDENKKVA